MTTTLDTSCSEDAMVLSSRRGFLHACISSSKYNESFLFEEIQSDD